MRDQQQEDPSWPVLLVQPLVHELLDAPDLPGQSSARALGPRRGLLIRDAPTVNLALALVCVEACEGQHEDQDLYGEHCR